MNRKFLCFWLVAVIFLARSSFGQGTAFFYQGQLNNGGAAANGYYNFKFTLFDAPSNGVAVSGSITNTDVPVSNGLFTTTLDFGPNIFTGLNLWLDIGVCTTNVGTNFTMLSPLQPVLPVPYAISAENLIGTVSASQLTGTLPATAFAGYTNTVAFTNGANLFAGSFNGNGAAVTNVSVTNLTGVLADSQLPNNTAFLNSNQVFTASNSFTGNNSYSGVNTYTNFNNSFYGSFFGNGLVGWVNVPGTTVSAQIDHGYVLTNSQIVTVTLPGSTNVGDIVRVTGAGSSGWELSQTTGQSVLGNFSSYGGSWSPSGAGAEDWSCIASSAGGSELAAAVYGGGIYVSDNSGASWTEPFSTAEDFESVASSSSGAYLAAAAAGGGDIYFSTNSGTSFPPLGSSGGVGTSFNWYSVALSSSGSQLVAASFGSSGNYAGLFVFSGASFERSNSLADMISVASSASGTNLIAASEGGDLYLSSNAGVSWTPVSSNPGSREWKSVASSSDGTKLAAAIYGGGIWTSVNSGANWSLTPAPTNNWNSLTCSSDGSKLVAVVYGGGIFTSGNWGTTWQSNAATAFWTGAASSSSGSLTAACIYNNTSSGLTGIYTSAAASQTVTTTGTNGYIIGSQGSAAEFQYIGNNQWMPVSSSGTLWAH